MAETVELEDYVKSIGGSSFVYTPENDDKSIKVRQGIEIFTQEELYALGKYRDFISLSTNWIVIPITVIGIDKEIRSGGLIFTANTYGEIFQWILDLFVNILPTKDILNTVISDEDSCLDGAFALIKNDMNNLSFKEKVLILNRVICS